MDAQKNAKLSVTVLRGVQSDRDAGLHWTKVTQAAGSWSYKHLHLWRREDFYHQIYFETVDTVANCIVEHFNHKDYT